MAATATTTRKAGDVIGVDHPDYDGQRWVISKAGPANYSCRPEGDPQARGLRVPHYMATDPPEAGTVSRRTNRPAGLRVGAFVTGARARGLTPETVLFVTKDGPDKVTVTLPGGDDLCRHWNLPVRGLTVVPLSVAAEMLYREHCSA
jgi:hypothetical protein